MKRNNVLIMVFVVLSFSCNYKRLNKRSNIEISDCFFSLSEVVASQCCDDVESGVNISLNTEELKLVVNSNFVFDSSISIFFLANKFKHLKRFYAFEIVTDTVFFVLDNYFIKSDSIYEIEFINKSSIYGTSLYGLIENYSCLWKDSSSLFVRYNSKVKSLSIDKNLEISYFKNNLKILDSNRVKRSGF